MKLAFSTVSCPDQAVGGVGAMARRLGCDGVELRTISSGVSPLLCEPWHTSTAKLREALEDSGARACSLATSISFDAPVFPPVIGHALTLTDTHPSVRDAKRSIELAARLECPFVRVFAFELPKGESRDSGLKRIGGRLELALACARHSGVRIALENGGSFPFATDLAEIIEMIDNPLLVAAYSPAVAAAAGEDPAEGVRALGSSLELVKFRDLAGPAGDRRPVVLGDGEFPAESVARQLGAMGYRGWSVVEVDRLWGDPSVDAEPIIAASFERLMGWWHAGAPSFSHGVHAVAGA